MDRPRPRGGGGGGQRPLTLIALAVLVGLAGAGIGFVAGLVTGRWSASVGDPRYTGDGWVLQAVDYTSGDPGQVGAERVGTSDDWLITVAMPGSGSVGGACPEPASVGEATVAPSGRVFTVVTRWHRRGCELGPTEFRFLVHGLRPPFEVGLVREDGCHTASFEEAGVVEAIVGPATDEACLQLRS